MEARQRLIKVDGWQALGAWIYGGSRKRLIVYLSPITLHGGWFKEALTKMAKELEATIIAIDLPGIGQSQGGVRTGDGIGLRNKFHSYYNFDLVELSQQLQEAICWLKREFLAEKVYAMGTSIGGVIQSYLLAKDRGKCLDGAIFQAGFASSQEEIGSYVSPLILKLYQNEHYWLKRKIEKLPIPVFFFTRWSKPSWQSVFLEFWPTIRLLYRVIQDPNTSICFNLSTLESLIRAPNITLPLSVPILFLQSGKDRGIVNQGIAHLLERHPCDQTIVPLRKASHIILNDEEQTKIAINAIQQWFQDIEGRT